MAYINITQAQVDSLVSAINARAKLNGADFTGPVSGTTFAGAFIGNSDTATKLATTHTINGVAFDGTADITVVDTTKAPIDSPVFTGQVFIPEGTATAPGLTFPNDGSQDTGLYHISDGSFGVTNNGTETVAFTPTGVNLLGTPTAPTAAVGTNTTQIATTAFVLANSSQSASTAGSIVQIQSVQTRTQGSFSAPTTGNGTEITPLNIVITPKKAGNVMILEWHVNGECHWDSVYLATRNGALLDNTTDQSNNRWAGTVAQPYDNNNDSTLGNVIIRIIDFNTLATQTTYTLCVRASSSTANTLYLNRTIGNAGSDGYETTLSTGTAMEILQ
jgi:hypothetical protein